MRLSKHKNVVFYWLKTSSNVNLQSSWIKTKKQKGTQAGLAKMIFCAQNHIFDICHSFCRWSSHVATRKWVLSVGEKKFANKSEWTKSHFPLLLSIVFLMKLDGLMRFIIMGIFQRITFSCSASKENLFVGYDHVENVIKPVNQEKIVSRFLRKLPRKFQTKGEGWSLLWCFIASKAKMLHLPYFFRKWTQVQNNTTIDFIVRLERLMRFIKM